MRSEEEKMMIEAARRLIYDIPNRAMETNRTEIHVYAELCGLIEKGNGFETANDRTIPSKLMLVVTEVSEAIQWVKTGVGDPLAEELSDIMIRLLAMIHWYHIDELNYPIWSWRYNKVSDIDLPEVRRFRVKPSIEETLWPIVDHLCSAMEHYRHGHKEDVLVGMERAVAYTVEVCDAYGIDWRHQIWEKCNKNLKRPYRHGKVRGN